ncbi:MAG: DUF1028 domain-containing protein [Chloroflexota bacterium]
MKQVYRWLTMGIILLIGIVLMMTQQPQTSYQGSTWSVVAVDQATGEMGVAAASCVGVHIDGLASLVPGVGAAATQAAFRMDNRNRVFDLLMAGNSAEAVIASMSNPDEDDDVGSRQYGVVTMINDDVETAGFTGADNGAWAGDMQDDRYAVSVQGNILEGEAVVNDALAAFQDNTLGALTLADRMMRTLEAGSAAGGDARCNVDGIEQTATAAFIMVARADDAPFATSALGAVEQDRPDAPWLYLTVLEPFQGRNPLLTLREAYNAWRVNNVADCASCDIEALYQKNDAEPIAVPSGGDNTLAQQRAARQQLVLNAISIGVILMLIGLLIYIWRRLRRSRQRQWVE